MAELRARAITQPVFGNRHRDLAKKNVRSLLTHIVRGLSTKSWLALERGLVTIADGVYLTQREAIKT